MPPTRPMSANHSSQPADRRQPDSKIILQQGRCNRRLANLQGGCNSAADDDEHGGPVRRHCSRC
ncbi:hypothetical protein AB664_39160 [Brucella anthropi]|uniref:Uncharacterized protein n=1 Tax=Brucella anthropi TaxID=529 RepID=A0A656Z4G8_BRUAN|nr:hypothetical protein AB664_39160 [Brucella anthropi]